MKAIAKTRNEPGMSLIEVPEPVLVPGSVLIKISAGSVCGTDLHIYEWDHWAQSRIQIPRVIGHEFCGTVIEVGEGVTTHKVGDFVASESHITCGKCRQCLAGQRHVCINTKILGVDVDGGFAPFAVIPAENARITPASIPKEIASFQDALGNAVHTVAAGPVKGQTLLITGMGPIGLFALATARALGAEKIIVTEVSPFRIELAHKMGADLILNPVKDDALAAIHRAAPGGVDGVIEMSGHPSSLKLGVETVRPGGRISLLGVYHDDSVNIDLNQIIFKGIDVQGIVGRRLWETWDLMTELLSSGRLDVSPIITHRLPFTEFQEGMELLKAGNAGKLVFSF